MHKLLKGLVVVSAIALAGCETAPIARAPKVAEPVGQAMPYKWTVGNAVPCWFNPAEPRDVIVIRGFGGAYLFALLPLLLFVLGVTSVVRTPRRW